MCSSDLELAAAWRVLQARERVAKSPCLLRRELDLSIRIVRDYLRPGLTEIVIDDLNTFKRVEELLNQLPQAQHIRLTLYQGLEDIFTYNKQQEAVAGISDILYAAGRPGDAAGFHRLCAAPGSFCKDGALYHGGRPVYSGAGACHGC